MAAKLKTGDSVIVINGRDKGVKGTIRSINPKIGRAVVSGVNLAIMHVKQSPNQKGGRFPSEKPIDLSNLMLIEKETGEPTRVGFRFENGKKVRFAKSTGSIIDDNERT